MLSTILEIASSLLQFQVREERDVTGITISILSFAWRNKMFAILF